MKYSSGPEANQNDIHRECKSFTDNSNLNKNTPKIYANDKSVHIFTVMLLNFIFVLGPWVNGKIKMKWHPRNENEQHFLSVSMLDEMPPTVKLW